MHIYRKMCQENCCTFSTNFVNKEKQMIFFLDVSCFFHSTIFKITYLWLNSVLFLKGTNLCTEDRLSSTKHWRSRGRGENVIFIHVYNTMRTITYLCIQLKQSLVDCSHTKLSFFPSYFICKLKMKHLWHLDNELSVLGKSSHM